MRRYIIERDRLADNVDILRQEMGGAAIYGVLKVDGYGLGLAPLAKVMAERGIDRFAITEPEDVQRVIDTGIPMRELLLLTPVNSPELAERLLATERVTFAIGSPAEGRLLEEAGLRLGLKPRVHVQIETGLGRFGVSWDKPADIRAMYESFPALEIVGTYTHFSGEKIERQFGRFQEVLRALEAWGVDPGLRHCCSSAAALLHPSMRLDGVRLGSAFLGRAAGCQALGLHVIGYCQCELQTVRTVRAGQSVGYGGMFRTRQDRKVAIVNIGAVNGLGGVANCGIRSASAGFKELLRTASAMWKRRAPTAVVNGSAAPVLGRIYSECAALDVTGIDCKPGDLAKLPLNPLYVKDMDLVWQEAAAE